MNRFASIVLFLFAAPLAAETTECLVCQAAKYKKDIGHLIVNQSENRIAIEYDYKQNGRGPTFAEELTLDERGYPIEWSIEGTTTFGTAVDEFFRVGNGTASWQDLTGTWDADVGAAVSVEE